MYRKIKIFIYTIGFILVSYFYYNEGIVATHTPPNTIIFSIIVLIISVIWIIVDYILSHILSIYKTTYKEHLIIIFSNLIFIIIVIFLVS